MIVIRYNDPLAYVLRFKFFLFFALRPYLISIFLFYFLLFLLVICVALLLYGISLI